MWYEGIVDVEEMMERFIWVEKTIEDWLNKIQELKSELYYLVWYIIIILYIIMQVVHT